MNGKLFGTLALAAMLSACAGKVDLRAGAAGPALPAGSSVALIGTSDAPPAVAQKAQQDVLAALAKRGHSLAPDGAARIEIGLTDRLASTGVALLGGETLSPAKRRKFLQSCKDRTYRLTLTYYGAGTDVPITRAWAEEHHCKAPLDASVAELAEKAVAALAAGQSSEIASRRATD